MRAPTTDGGVTAFQFTRPRGARRRACVSRERRRRCFNSRAREGRDRCNGNQDRKGGEFQFTRPRGARPKLGKAIEVAEKFQCTRPRGARLHRGGGGRAGRGFNSRAREGRDSIWGFRLLASVFQFTRPRGARRFERADGRRDNLFQFTRPRGARRTGDLLPGLEARFQFTRPRGARHSGTTLVTTVFEFQFTRPRGARRGTGSTTNARSSSFNSRAREGRDAEFEVVCQKLFVSIHAPARGATFVQILLCAERAFQFTRPRGARRRSPPALRRPSFGFNSRAREGRDKKGGAAALVNRAFQFTRPRGARPPG